MDSTCCLCSPRPSPNILLLAMSWDYVYCRKQGFRLRVDDVASNVWQAIHLGFHCFAQLVDCAKRLLGRGLHSSTFRLNVSTFCGIRWVHDFPPDY